MSTASPESRERHTHVGQDVFDFESVQKTVPLHTTADIMQISQLNNKESTEDVNSVLDVSEELDLPNNEALRDVKKQNAFVFLR